MRLKFEIAKGLLPQKYEKNFPAKTLVIRYDIMSGDGAVLNYGINGGST